MLLMAKTRVGLAFLQLMNPWWKYTEECKLGYMQSAWTNFEGRIQNPLVTLDSKNKIFLWNIKFSWNLAKQSSLNVQKLVAQTAQFQKVKISTNNNLDTS